MHITMMKKLIAFLVILIMTAVPANAFVQSEMDANLFTDILTVRIAGLNPGQEYVLLVFPEGENTGKPNLQNLLLIDQLTASSNGTLTLGIQNAQPCFAMLGGIFDDEASPITLGNYSGNETPENILTAPQNLQEIKEAAFAGSAFNYIYISENTYSIGSKAFMNCTELYGIVIPASVTAIGENAFAGCDKLVIVCAENSVAHQYAIQNDIDYTFVK